MMMRSAAAFRRRAGLKNRDGFTLVEVIIASVILTGALLAMAGFSVRYQQIDGKARLLSRAQQAATQRLETVRSSQPYNQLDTMQTTESTVDGFPGYSRITKVTHVGGTTSDTVDYRIVTVKVLTPNGTHSVQKTSIVGAF
jgi:prepilin-type N-terminal cleavage/methylation domain-containing protein